MGQDFGGGDAFNHVRVLVRGKWFSMQLQVEPKTRLKLAIGSADHVGSLTKSLSPWASRRSQPELS